MTDTDRRVPRPRAAAMREHAAAFVARATRRGRLPLDYGVPSLRVVDFIVSGLRKDTPDPDRVEGALFGLGAYVGEVLVRRAGAVWVDLDESQRAYFGQDVGVRMPDGRVWNPLGKVRNRFELGPEESLQTFYLTLHGRRKSAPPAFEERGSGGWPPKPTAGLSGRGGEGAKGKPVRRLRTSPQGDQSEP